MENSINFLHPINTIKSSTDGKLFKKEGGFWSETNNILYKSEKRMPTDDLGNVGDYFVRYLRRYNYFLYSEDFSQNCWNKNHSKVNKEPSLFFPYNNPSKLTATEELSEHGLDYLFYNELRQTYTFSIYAKRNEIKNIALGLSDQYEKYGVNIKTNLITNTATVTQFGATDDIENTSGNVEVLDNNVVRISVTAKFKSTLILKAGIKLLDENMNHIFQPINETYGLFINSAQLTESSTAEEYIFSNGTYASCLIFHKLFNKTNEGWIETNGKIHYLTDEPTNDYGNNEDLACLDAIISFEPLIKAGSSETISRWDRPVGTMFYNPHKDKWYVKTKKGDYSLVFRDPKPNYYGAAIAMTMNQQVYQTANRYGHVRHMKGFNTGGNRNFWIRNTGKTRI